MLIRVLRPIPAGGATLMPGEVYDASGWANLRDLVAMEFAELLPEAAPTPDPIPPTDPDPAPRTPDPDPAALRDLAPAPRPAAKRKGR